MVFEPILSRSSIAEHDDPMGLQQQAEKTQTLFQQAVEAEGAGPLIDPRTGVPYGSYSEEEIHTSMADSIGVATMISSHESTVAPVETALGSQIDSHPEGKEVKDGIIGISKNLLQIGYKQGQVNNLRSKYLYSGSTPEERDERFLQDAEPILREIEALHSELPEQFEPGFLKEIVRETSSFAGQMGNMGKTIVTDAIRLPVDFGPIGLLRGEGWDALNPLKAILQSPAGALAQYPVAQATGEIYGSLSQNENIDPDIAASVAQTMGVVAGAADTVGLGGVAFGGGGGAVAKGVLPKIISFLGGISGEGATEITQSYTEDIATYFAERAQAERNGEEFTAQWEDYLDHDKALASGRAGVMGGIGMAGIAGGVSKTGQVVKKKVGDARAARAIEERTAREEAAQQEAAQVEQDRQERVQMDADSTKPTQPIVDLETGQTLDTAPIGDRERAVAYASPRVDGTDITDTDIDDAVILDDDEGLAASENLLRRAIDGTSDMSADFSAELRNILPEVEARGIEDLIDARASAVGTTRDKYISDRGIILEQVTSIDGTEGAPSAQLIIEEGRAIIQAFSKADVSSVAHEIGHIFRRDIAEADQRILDDWAGVDQGAQWDVAAEEKFARAWELYLREGQAPTPQLQGVFDQFTRWMTEIYKKVRNSPIDVELTDEVRGVMDRMLSKRLEDQGLAANTQQDRMILEQRQTPADQLRAAKEQRRIARIRRTTKQRAGIRYGTARLTGTLDEKKRAKSEIRQRLDELEAEVSTVQNQINDKLKEKGRAKGKKAKAKVQKEIDQLREQKRQELENFEQQFQDRQLSPEERAIRNEMKSLKQQRKMLDKRLRGVYEDFAPTLQEIEGQRQVLQEMLDLGDKLGYANARADMKVMLTRAKNRSAVQKRHTALRKKYLKAIEKALKKQAKTAREGLSSSGREFLRNIYNDIKGSKKGVGAARELYDQHVLSDDRDWIDLEMYEQVRNRFLEAAITRSDEGVQQLQELYSQLNAFIEGHMADTPVVQHQLMADRIVRESRKDVNGMSKTEQDEALASQSADQYYEQNRKKLWQSPKEFFGKATLGHSLIFGWGGLMDMISSYSDQIMGNSTLRKALDFHEPSQAKQTQIREAKEKMFEQYKNIFGLNQWKANEKVIQDAQVNMDIGNGLPLYSRQQLRQIYMYMQDPNLTRRLKKKHGITNEVRQTITNVLSEQDKQFAMWQTDQYAQEYDRNNAAHMEVYGVSLPRIPNYVPIKAEAAPDTGRIGLVANTEGIPQWKQDVILRKSPETTGHLKDRALDAYNSRLVIEGDIGLFNSYQEEMSHFRNYSVPVRVAKMTVEALEDAIVMEYGRDVYNSIQKNLEQNAADGMMLGNVIPILDTFRSAFVTSKIGMSFGVMSKQFISVVNFWQDMPMSELVVGLGSYFKHPVRNTKALMQHDFFKNRKNMIDRDLRQLTNSNGYKRHIKHLDNPTLKNIISANVRIGDTLAIAIGGHAYVRYLQKQGLTYEQAVDAMVRKADRTQQSGSTHELSAFQAGGSANRVLTMFSTGPVQAIRQELEAARGLASGRTGGAQFAKTMFIYHVLVPTAYSVSASLLGGAFLRDEEEWLKDMGQEAAVAAALGPFGVAYSIGRTVTNAVRWGVGLKRYPNGGPFPDTIQDIGKVANRLTGELREGKGLESLTADDYAAALEAMSILSGRGIPVQRGTRMVQGAVDAAVSEDRNRADAVRRAITGSKPPKE